MKYKVAVVKNKQHDLMPEQKDLLHRVFPEDEIEFVEVPPEGWTKYEMIEIGKKLREQCHAVVFVSPVPYLLATMSMSACSDFPSVYLFHNDFRDKIEKDGKVFYRVPKTGWQLIEIVGDELK